MAGRRTLRIAENFDRNLGRIRLFWEETGAPDVFGCLLDELFLEVIPLLEQFPEVGADFLARRPQSIIGVARAELLRRRLGGDTTLREHVFGDYLLLYALRPDDVVLLAIRHHRQLSFDFRRFWAL